MPQISVKNVYELVELKGISPTQAVIRAIYRLGLPCDLPSAQTFQSSIEMKNATTALEKHFFSRQKRDALKTQNRPNVKNIHTAPIGSHELTGPQYRRS